VAFNKYTLRKAGAEIHYVAENIPQTPEGVILESVLEGMAEYFSLQLSQNVRRGMLTSAQKARYTGGPIPLGYAVDETKRFVPDPDTAPIVAEIFRRYADGESQTSIIDSLNARGILSPRGKIFTHNSLRTVLRNEKYIGVYKYKDQVRIEDAIPPIVEKELFSKVQQMIIAHNNSPAHDFYKTNYLLTGKLFCGHCGESMAGISGTSATGAKYSYYACKGKTAAKRYNASPCSKKNVQKAYIEKTVLDLAVSILQDNDLIEFIASNTAEYYASTNDRSPYIKAIKSDLAEVEKAYSNIMKAIESGIFSAGMQSRLIQLDEQKTKLQEALITEESAQKLSISKERIMFFLYALRSLDISQEEFQKKIIDIFINSVFVFDDKITITFNYSDYSRTITPQDYQSAKVLFCDIKACQTTEKRTFALLLNVFSVTIESW